MPQEPEEKSNKEKEVELPHEWQYVGKKPAARKINMPTDLYRCKKCGQWKTDKDSALAKPTELCEGEKKDA